MSLSLPQDARFSQLNNWLAGLTALSLKLDSIRPASNDASFRRYFRLDTADGASLIAVDAPPERENVPAYIQVAQLLDGAGVTVPKILAQDVEQGFLVVSDLGNATYLNQLNPDSAHKLYIDALDALVMIQVHSRPGVLPEYDREFLSRELNIFTEWYLGKHLGVTLSEAQNKSLQAVFDALLANILAQPQVWVHRDYHSRNLMVLPKGNPGILDFQDARYGPITYDVVSLLRDAYIQWDEEVVLDLAIRYWERAKRAGLPVAPDIDSFYRDFEFTGLQRHLKILGIFARLHHRDGKDAYLNDLPLVMTYVRNAAGRYKALKPLLLLLDQLEGAGPKVGYTF
ncbi:MAG TPA: phosphotransferase [Burkholderiaceae bacterium]